MSVSIEVCKDVEQFQENVVAGMDARHTLFALAGIIAGSAAGAISHFLLHLNYMITMYTVMFAAIPIIFIGFMDKDGMGILERMKKSRALRKSGTYYYISTESPEYFENILNKQESAVQKKKDKDEMQKQIRLLICMGIFVFILVIAVMAVLLL